MDERKSFPSASGIEALMLCPGRWQLERTVADESDDEATEVSKSGDRIHAFMAGLPAELSDDEERVAEKFRRDEETLVAELVPGARPAIRETRLWLTPQEDTFSGKPDAVFLGPSAILIEDYKSGWLGATPAPRNPQLRALAVLVARKYNALTPRRPIYVAALLRSGAPTVAEYGMEDIARARGELELTIASATAPDALRVVGSKQCQYCRAKGICPEANAAVSTLAVLETREIETTDLVRLLDVCGAAEKVIGSLRATAKRRLEADPESVPGWKLKEGAQREKVTDIQAVHGRVQAAGVTTEAFTSACSITKTSLKDVLKAGTGMKGKSLDELVRRCTAGAVGVTQCAPSLERVA